MHRGALAALVERGLSSVCLGRIRAEPSPLGMPQKVIQRLKSDGIILKAHEYHKDHYVWRPGPKYDHFMQQLVAMEDRVLCHPKK